MLGVCLCVCVCVCAPALARACVCVCVTVTVCGVCISDIVWVMCVECVCVCVWVCVCVLEVLWVSSVFLWLMMPFDQRWLTGSAGACPWSFSRGRASFNRIRVRNELELPGKSLHPFKHIVGPQTERRTKTKTKKLRLRTSSMYRCYFIFAPT